MLKECELGYRKSRLIFLSVPVIWVSQDGDGSRRSDWAVRFIYEQVDPTFWQSGRETLRRILLSDVERGGRQMVTDRDDPFGW